MYGDHCGKFVCGYWGLKGEKQIYIFQTLLCFSEIIAN